ncbi:MAG: cobyrinate a,c-diamide synthase [Fusobacteriaceae bacterium]
MNEEEKKEERKKRKGFILSGVSSGIGKTTISIGLMNIFKNVSAFKSGPDFIDPTFHSFVTKNNSYNLDLFIMGDSGVKYSLYNHLRDFNIIEGAMGLYDGIDNSLDNYSVAHLSRVLEMPVILVVDGGGKGTSIASQVLGYKLFDPRVNIIGVIINKVNSEKTYNLYKEAIEKYTGIKSLGYLSKNEEFNIESRHLGLLRANEVMELEIKVQKISEELKKNVDIKFIEKECSFEIEKPEDIFEIYRDKYKGIKMGIAKDRAFSFYYNDNLELLKKMGIELKYFSPLIDKEVPDVDFLYFGGGYPENYLEELSLNKNMLQSIEVFYKKNKTILGECGGFMYLSQGIENLNGEFFKLCSILDCEIKMFNRLDISRFGYINILYNGLKGKGHEFHYSKISKSGDMDKKYEVYKKDGRHWSCGYSSKKILAGYPHLHFFKSIDILEALLKGVEKN